MAIAKNCPTKNDRHSHLPRCQILAKKRKLVDKPLIDLIQRQLFSG